MPLIFKSMASSKGVVFDEKNIEQEELASDVTSLISEIGKITEDNIDEVSRKINEDTAALGKKHYRYN